jgi:hypothetical protein
MDGGRARRRIALHGGYGRVRGEPRRPERRDQRRRQRVPLDGSAASDALSMPIDRPGTLGIFAASGDGDDPRLIDARGFGKDLAIGVRTGWKENAVRVVRIDTSKL